MRRRAGAAGDLLGRKPDERLDTVPLDCRNGVLPRPDLRLARRRPEPAVVAEMRVDPVLLTESADRPDSVRRGAAEPQRLLAADGVLQLYELRPQREHEAAVAPARAATANVPLDDHDVERRGRAPSGGSPSRAPCSRRRRCRHPPAPRLRVEDRPRRPRPRALPPARGSSQPCEVVGQRLEARQVVAARRTGRRRAGSPAMPRASGS